MGKGEYAYVSMSSYFTEYILVRIFIFRNQRMSKELNKALQVINLSPVNESFFDKLENVSPMKMVVYASIIQFMVFFGMLGIISFLDWLI